MILWLKGCKYESQVQVQDFLCNSLFIIYNYNTSAAWAKPSLYHTMIPFLSSFCHKTPLYWNVQKLQKIIIIRPPNVLTSNSFMIWCNCSKYLNAKPSDLAKNMYNRPQKLPVPNRHQTRKINSRKLPSSHSFSGRELNDEELRFWSSLLTNSQTMIPHAFRRSNIKSQNRITVTSKCTNKSRSENKKWPSNHPVQ